MIDKTTDNSAPSPTPPSAGGATAHLDYDKFPGLLENPAGYRKGSDDYGVTFAVPIKYVPRLQPLMQKAGRVFVVYLVQVSSAEQAELLMGRDDSGLEPQVGAPEPQVMELGPVSVEELASWLCCGERNVQILENKGIAIKAGRGQYDLKTSVQGYIRELHAKGDGKNSDYNKERTESIRLKRMERELGYHERAGNLVNANAVRSVIEKAKAAEKQQVLFMPKQLAPRLEGDPAVNEAVLEEWAHSFLKGQTEINITTDVSPAPDVDKMPEMKLTKKRKGKGDKHRPKTTK